MAALLDDIATYLISKTFATAIGVDIFTDFVSDKPDHLISLNEYGGDGDVTFETVTQRSVQILVRDKDGSIAKSTAWNIYNLLKEDNHKIKFTSTRLGIVYLRQTPFKNRTDQNKRVLYGFNIGITTEND